MNRIDETIELEPIDVAAGFNFAAGGELARAGPGREVAHPSEPAPTPGLVKAWAASHRPTHLLVRKRLADAKLPVLRFSIIVDEAVRDAPDEQLPEFKARAAERLAQLPAMADLEREIEALRMARNTPATPLDVRLLTTAIDAAYPSAARKWSADFVALVELILDEPIDDGREEWFVSATVLYSAFVILTLQTKFLPTIAELWEAIHAAKKRYDLASMVTHRMLALRRNAEVIFRLSSAFDDMDEWENYHEQSNVTPIRPEVGAAHRGKRRRPAGA